MTSFTLTAQASRPVGVCGYCGERGPMESLARRETDSSVEEAGVCVHCTKKDPLYLASAFHPQRRRPKSPKKRQEAA